MEDLHQMRDYISNELSNPNIGYFRRWDMQSALRFIEGQIAAEEKLRESAGAENRI